MGDVRAERAQLADERFRTVGLPGDDTAQVMNKLKVRVKILFLRKMFF